MNITVTSLAESKPAIRTVREEVFVGEQRVPRDIEWDGNDPNCIHVVACDDDGTPIGTGRIQLDGRIGRLAVREPWRGKGIGSAMLQTLIDAACVNDIHELHLHAQVDTVPFYEKQGFSTTGGEFMEADIRHITMIRTL